MKLVWICIFLIYAGNISAQNPSLSVLDTDFSKGRLTNLQTISLSDAAKFHGHLCDGLAVGFLGLREALYRVYTDSIVDRTNTRIVSKSPPCLTDIAIYLTGGRYQFNSFYVSDSIKYLFVVQRIDKNQTFGVTLKPGIKPNSIDSLGKLSVQGKLDPCGIDSLQKIEELFTKNILASNPQEIFIVEEIINFNWQSSLKNTFIKTDIINKKLPVCKMPGIQ